MRIIKLSSITFLFLCLTFGTMVSCDGDGDQDEELAGELICNDGIDNDNDGDTDCEDIDCILAPNCVPASCEDVLDANCQLLVDCELSTFEDCILAFEIVGIVCENVESTATQECINDIDETSCEDVEMGILPESCGDTLEILGLCDECEVDEDCPVGLFCFPCTAECSGVVSRCTSQILFAECTDGIFRTQE